MTYAMVLTPVKAKFANSKFCDSQAIKAMLDYFEKTTKPGFAGATAKAFIKTGNVRDRDPKFGIKHGQFFVEG